MRPTDRGLDRGKEEQVSTSARADRHDGDSGQNGDSGQDGDGQVAAHATGGEDREPAAGSVHERSGGSGREYALLLFIGGILGTLASIALTIDYINLLRNPDYVPACDINPLVVRQRLLREEKLRADGYLSLCPWMPRCTPASGSGREVIGGRSVGNPAGALEKRSGAREIGINRTPERAGAAPSASSARPPGRRRSARPSP